ncbi:hypothetical protein Tco_1241242, partial [Tanacetum coccineum]
TNHPKVEVVVVRGCNSRGGGSWWLSWVVPVRGGGERGGDVDDDGWREGGGGGVELVTRMAAGVWGSDDGDGHEGGVMVAAVGRQPEEVEARERVT